MSQLLNQICPNVVEYFPELLQALTDTLWMVGISGFFAIIIGLPIGVLLVVTREGHLLQNKALNLVLGKVINVFRSIPFIILLAFIMPLTRAIVGTTIGLKGAIVPLVI